MNVECKVRRGPTAILLGLYAALLVASVVVTGCGNKEASTAATPPTSQQGVAPSVSNGETKGTPEQEAAKAKAMQQGPSIEAANEAARAAAAAGK